MSGLDGLTMLPSVFIFFFGDMIIQFVPGPSKRKAFSSDYWGPLQKGLLSAGIGATRPNVPLLEPSFYPENRPSGAEQKEGRLLYGD